MRPLRSWSKRLDVGLVRYLCFIGGYTGMMPSV